MEKKYTQDHEWIELDTDGKTATLGISKHAASALGDVVYVELPQDDMEIVAGDAIGSVESVKSASDILTPVSGQVVETNKILEEKPSALNSDPEGAAWIAKIVIEGASLEEAAKDSELMDAEAYRKFTEEASED
ncbi:glycine cleavage H-protein [Pseudovirgaria hyperparasitica]|uniref:Glycine cleavage system H protein n=1 Tax=Pseudovirgaria hyperparasitica TaxID=470096 RepID=A0A6A6WKB6_9PEZI|nr:glycine cleavage H-protein [Pseudovirgaria hyperparasitica]KAF2762615.1 glycine cleavage H-protein [Pseudovirgaria hyperparasitica]